MRIAFAYLLVASPAFAEDTREVSVSAGHELIGEEQHGTVAGAARYAKYDQNKQGKRRKTATATGTLRGGTDWEAAASANATYAIGYDVGDRVIEMFGGDITYGFGARPALDARRDLGRGSYASKRATFWIGLPADDEVASNPERGGYFRITTTTEQIVQLDPATPEEDRRQVRVEATIDSWFNCHLQVNAPARCIHAGVLDIWGASTGGGAVIAKLDGIRVEKLGAHGIYLDVAAGGLTNRGTLEVENTEGGPPHTFESTDLPAIDSLTYDAGLTIGNRVFHVAARGSRAGFITLDGDMALEDRATFSATLALRRATVGLRGFAARTTWWTAKDDPGQTAETGGGELVAAFSIRGFDITAGLGRARTFYPTLDGAAVDKPALGTRASLGITRTIGL